MAPISKVPWPPSTPLDMKLENISIGFSSTGRGPPSLLLLVLDVEAVVDDDVPVVVVLVLLPPLSAAIKSKHN